MSLFPKVLWPFNFLTLTQNKPWVLWMLSITWSFLPDNEWALHIYIYMPCTPMQIKPNKSPLRNKFLVFLFWEIGYLSSPSRSGLGRLIFIHGGRGALRTKLPHTLPYLILFFWLLLFTLLFIINYLSCVHILVPNYMVSSWRAGIFFVFHTTHGDCLEHFKNSVNTCDGIDQDRSLGLTAMSCL